MVPKDTRVKEDESAPNMSRFGPTTSTPPNATMVPHCAVPVLVVMNSLEPIDRLGRCGIMLKRTKLEAIDSLEPIGACEMKQRCFSTKPCGSFNSAKTPYHQTVRSIVSTCNIYKK